MDRNEYHVEPIAADELPEYGFILDSGENGNVLVRDISTSEVVAEGKNVNLDLLYLAEQCYIRGWEETENILKRAITD